MARRPHVGNATEFSKLEQGGRLLLSVAMLGLSAACGGDQALAPTAGPVAGPTAGGAAVTRSGVELLVLVDEAGQARRVLIVRDERDPRVRAVERLGFRTLTSEALAAGGVDASTRAMFAAGEGKGLPVRYQRTAGVWTQTMDAEVGNRAAEPMLVPPRASAYGAATAGTIRTTVDSALASLEATMNEVLADDLRLKDAGPGRDVQPTDCITADAEDPCADERSDANWERLKLTGKTIGIAAGFVMMAETPALWPSVPRATLAASGVMAEQYADYGKAMRELRQCEAAH